MPVNRNRKGKEFERLIAGMLHSELGLRFTRNLEQTREVGLGDLLCEVDRFPFLLECKHQSTPRLASWWEQAVTAAKKSGQVPALVYRITGKAIVVRVPLYALCEGLSDHPVEMGLEAFCEVARETMG